MLDGVLQNGVVRVGVGFDGKASLRRAKAQDMLDVVRTQNSIAAAEVPSNQLDGQPASQDDARGLGVAPNIVLGGGSHVALATRRAAHNYAARDFRSDAGT